MLGSRVVLGWVMVVGADRRPARRVATGVPVDARASTLGRSCSSAGICYVVGLQLDLRGAAHRQGLDRRPDRRDGGRRRGAHRRRPRRPDGARRRRSMLVRHRRRRRPVVARAGRPTCRPATSSSVGRRARRPGRADGPTAPPPADGRSMTTRGPPACRSVAALVFGVGLVASGRVGRRSSRSPGSPSAARGWSGIVVVRHRRCSCSGGLRVTRARAALVVDRRRSARSSARCCRPGAPATASPSRRCMGSQFARHRRRSPPTSCSASAFADPGGRRRADRRDRRPRPRSPRTR